MDKHIKNEEGIDGAFPSFFLDHRNLNLSQAFLPSELNALFTHHFQPKIINFEGWNNENQNQLKTIETEKSDKSSKLKKKRIRKTKAEKMNLLDSINNQNLEHLKKVNLKNTYINKIHHLIKEEEIDETPEKNECLNNNEVLKQINKAEENVRKFKFENNLLKQDSEFREEPSNTSRNLEKLEKNRESARNSRKRKKIYIMLLENKLSDLNKEIKNLKKELEEKQYKSKFESKPIDDFLTEKESVFEKLEQMLKNYADPQEISLLLDSLRLRFCCSGKERKTVIKNLFSQTANYLLPPYAKYLMTSAFEGRLFFNSKKGMTPYLDKNVFEMQLQSLMDLTNDQKIKFMKYQVKLANQKQIYDQLVGAFFNIENEFLKENENLQSITDEIRGFLNPQQFAKLCLILEKQKDIFSEGSWREFTPNHLLLNESKYENINFPVALNTNYIIPPSLIDLQNLNNLFYSNDIAQISPSIQESRISAFTFKRENNDGSNKIKKNV